MKIAFTGRPKLGGVKMRGRSVAEAMGVPFVPLKDVRIHDNWDVLIVVKYYDLHAVKLRQAAKRLIFDPLDCWMQGRAEWDPVAFWRECYAKLQFDAIIATSPACDAVMQEALPVPVHLALHHADPRIKPDWFDPSGPVVYCGGRPYLGSRETDIRRRVERHGREFRVFDGNDAWQGLQGASLSLNVRYAPHDTPLNQECKPQVKLENANAAGVPTASVRHPCVYESDAWLPLNTERWVLPKPQRCERAAVTLEDHCERIREIINAT